MNIGKKKKKYKYKGYRYNTFIDVLIHLCIELESTKCQKSIFYHIKNIMILFVKISIKK